MLGKIFPLKDMIDILKTLSEGFDVTIQFGLKVGSLKCIFACKVKLEPLVACPKDNFTMKRLP